MIFFETNQGKEFVGFAQGDKNQLDCRKKMMKYHFLTRHYRYSNRIEEFAVRLVRFLLEKTVNSLIKRKEDLSFCKGPLWISITDDLCAYILDKAETVSKRFAHTFCPDEIFVQTIVRESSFYARCYHTTDEMEGCVREIDWQRGHPYEWTAEDKGLLMKSNRLFSRKITERNMDLALWIQDTFGA